MENIKLHRITATAIIVKNGKYLITKRSPNEKAFPNKWHVPGGGVDTDDYINSPRNKDNQWYFAIETSLRREIKEEVNLELKNLNYLLDLAFIRPDGVPVIVLSYWAYYKSGKVDISGDEENVEWCWVTLKEARSYDLIDGIWEEIEMVDKILKGAKSDKIKYRKK